MAEKAGMIRWFLEELPKLRESGVIDSGTEEKLQHHYRERLAGVPSAQKYFLLALSIVGSVLIAGGIILLFNYNWDMFTKTTRIAIAFLPMALGAALSVFTLTTNRPQAWREGSAVLTSAGTAVAIALLSQIYHTGGTLSEFMTLVLLLALPLIYIFDSISLATLYCVGLFMTLDGWDVRLNFPMCFCLLAGILPFAGWHLVREASPYRIWMRYLAMGFTLFAFIAFGTLLSIGLVLFTICAVFMFAAIEPREKGEHLLKNPWLPASFLLLLVLLSVGTCIGGRIFKAELYRGNAAGIEYYWLTEAFFLILFILLFVRDYFRKHMDFHRVMLLILIGLGFMGAILESINTDNVYTRLAMNVYMGVFGIMLILRGCRETSMLAFNGGLLMCALLIGLRFFDADIGLLARAIGFIVLGLGFIGANVFFSRRLARAKNAEVNHA